ncbi:hypothetical protein pipiens_008053 [Culex pipiens pipiens]|uniref:Uncharacterized protein n=1 Tax=Culex pipiens pipiens TaxID=38569 RepID=A0ABD1DJA2_CULPP
MAVVTYLIMHIVLFFGVLQRNCSAVQAYAKFALLVFIIHVAAIVIKTCEEVLKLKPLLSFEVLNLVFIRAVEVLFMFVCICFGFLNWLAIWVICGVKRYNRLEKSRKLAEHGNAASTSNLNCCCKYISYLCLCSCFSCFYKDAVKHENNSPAGGPGPTKPENVPESGLTEPTPGTSVQKNDHVITSASFNKSENEESVNLLMDKQSTRKKSRC